MAVAKESRGELMDYGDPDPIHDARVSGTYRGGYRWIPGDYDFVPRKERGWTYDKNKMEKILLCRTKQSVSSVPCTSLSPENSAGLHLLVVFSVIS